MTHRSDAIVGGLDVVDVVSGDRESRFGAETAQRGNNDWATLRRELKKLREDLVQSDFPRWLEVRRQHYVVSVGARDDGLLDELERRIFP